MHRRVSNPRLRGVKAKAQYVKHLKAGSPAIAQLFPTLIKFP